MNKINITCIIGGVSSGKTTYAAKLETPTRKIVDVGSIVRELTKDKNRVFNKTLDSQITDRLLCDIELCMHNECDLVIVGIRQETILKNLILTCSSYLELDVDVIVLEVSDEERKRRFELRQDKKETFSFEEVDKREKELGWSELMQFIQTYDRKIFIKN